MGEPMQKFLDREEDHRNPRWGGVVATPAAERRVRGCIYWRAGVPSPTGGGVSSGSAWRRPARSARVVSANSPIIPIMLSSTSCNINDLADFRDIIGCAMRQRHGKGGPQAARADDR